MRCIKLLSKDNIKIFLKFVEIQTKIASVFPMLIGIMWALYRYQAFNGFNTFLFIIAVLFFDMCTTAINNTMDYYKAKSERYIKEENVIGIYNLSPRNMVIILFVLLAIAIIFSILLVFKTDPILLILGAICFFIGVMYTYGPTPISRTPYGEFFSGFTMGFGIFFLAIFIQDPALLISTQWDVPLMTLNWHWLNTIEIFMMSLPLVSLIANIMLANNIRDLDTDIENERFTLVYYVGRPFAIILYQVLSALPWLFFLLFLLLGNLPWWCAIAFIGVVPHYRSVMTYRQKYMEKPAFGEAIKSFILFASIYLLILIIVNISTLF